MANTFLPYGRQSINEADIEAVVDVLRGDWLTTGPAVDAFEDAFKARVGATESVACSDGTAALHLATLALGLGEGDHVIVPAVTFLATANAVRYVGAEVIFADVDPETGLMRASDAETALKKAGDKAVKAVIPVHLGGQCSDPAALKALADQHDLRIIEDACHAVGTEYDVGAETFAVGACAHSDLATFSFHPVKTLTTGEGGMVTGADPALMKRVRLLRNHGMSHEKTGFQNTDLAFEGSDVNPWYYEMREMGHNYRLSDLHCALGLSQLSRLDDALARRTHLVAMYRDRLSGLAPVVRPLRAAPACRPGWHLFAVRIDFDALGLSRREVMKALSDAGIGSQVHYIPVNRQPYYQERYGDVRLPGAEEYYASCLSLPLHVGMRDEDVERVVSTLEKIIAGSMV